MNNTSQQKHAAFVRENGGECTVLLKKDGRFPLKSPGKIALYGSGARRTVKGGTGSGEVNSRYFISAEDGLKAAGFEITSGAWIDGYDHAIEEAKARFMKNLKAEAKAAHQNIIMISMGRKPAEPEYNLPLSGEGDTAVYVLSRNSGEGADRDAAEGDVLLSATEIRDITECAKKYPNFMLVINTGGPVDLTPVLNVGNILILSQLGADTGHILADIILGKQVPSGKLATTWAAWSDYCTLGEFAEKDDTRYKEGIYVGYRYFDSVGKEPVYPFGYGISYTDFEISEENADINDDIITASAKIRNAGSFSGKEVLQIYVSLPYGKLDEPYQVLSGFAKTGFLAPGEEETVSVSFSLRDIAPYDEGSESYILEAGDYIIRIGNSSRNTKIAALARLGDTVTVLKTKNLLGKPDFDDFKGPVRRMSIPEGIKVLNIEKSAISTETVTVTPAEEIAPEIAALSREQLIKMNLGAYKPNKGSLSMIGNNGFTVPGAAGQTNMEAGFPSMVMADGPAGLRLFPDIAVSKDGSAHALGSTAPSFITDVASGPVKLLMKLMSYHPKPSDKKAHQDCTAIPIGTAIAQTFNLSLAEAFGRIVGEEMVSFGVHLWLAPALNIHRSILCGRNFEYYSEDPLISGMFAGALTKGVQASPHTGTTIKHYAFNNQERNRTQNSSSISERAAREIYLRGFGVCVKEAQPKAVMTSYNLINGKHTSEHCGLIEGILRAQFGFKGIVMTDWVVAGFGGEPGSVHPVADAGNVAAAGGDLFMPGSAHDYARIEEALRSGVLTEKQLRINATRVLKMARDLVE